ncbi:MAG: hypothetical protein HYV90_05665 [Candidatus Woesebacteria bacterium]|nr:MAG: hypothetical protein HYV90_05665 [Candidatus Woesebacteria bacterium]
MKKFVVFPAALFVLTHFLLVDDDLIIFGQTPPAPTTTEAQVASVLPQITISATVGTPMLKLWGYGAPNSKIELNGDRVSDFAYTRADGYFEFPKIYLPTPTGEVYPELCLTGIDQTGRSTPPTCIPDLPANESSFDIGPVIMPPTLSLEEGVTTQALQTGASGITIPNSEVKIVLAEDSSTNIGKFDIVREARAYYIPNYTVKSDKQGYFSFNMPDASPKTWHVFAITKYSQGASSPKSNTLKFVIISQAANTFENIWAFILSLLALPSLIILEIVVILLILTATFLSKKDKRRISLNTTKQI